MQDTKKIFSALPATGDRILCAGIKILSRYTEPELITIEETAPSYPKVMTVDSLLWGVVWKISKIIYYYNPHIQLKAIRYHQKEWIRHCLQSSNSAPTYTSWCIFSPMFTDTQRDAHRSNFYNRKLWPPHTHSHTHIYKYIYFIIKSEKTMAPTPVLLPGKFHGRRSLVGCSPWGRYELDTTEWLDFTFHFHALEKEMATHSSVLAWRISGIVEPGGLPSMGSHRVGQEWSNSAAAANAT